MNDIIKVNLEQGSVVLSSCKYTNATTYMSYYEGQFEDIELTADDFITIGEKLKKFEGRKDNETTD